jgi:lipopolysaccharide biosynthesis protein/SAM-dependent methyltransferase
MKSFLSALGYELDPRFGVWRRPEYGGITYSDGDEVESRIAQIILNTPDVSLFSEDLVRHCTDWPSTYHLSPQRANILRPFESLLTGDILEIGAGCGAITRFLGESGGTVLALEGSPRRAGIARERTRDLSNVTVVSENFDLFECEKGFDLIVMIGVLEYASLFMNSADPARAMLQKVCKLLKPGGRVVVAIENQLGLKYFAGAPEDHLGLPMYGIEGRYRNGQPQTYGKLELAEKFLNAGFGSTEFLAPFPDYKLPISIVTESGFSSPNFDGSAFAWQSVWSDIQLPRYLSFSPTLVWPTIEKNGLGIDLANSFLIIAGKALSPSVESSRFAWHFSTSRKKEFCKATHFLKNEDGKVEVTYQRLFPELADSAATNSLVNVVSERAEYVKGRCLSWDIIQILSQDGWNVRDVSRFFIDYFDKLSHIAKSQGEAFLPTSHSVELSGSLYDCVPRNLLVAQDGTTVFIDQEWVGTSPFEAGHILLRALMLPAAAFSGRPDQTSNEFDGTRLGLLQAVAADLGWSLSKDQIHAYAEREVAVFQEVLIHPPSIAEYIQWLDESVTTRLHPEQQLADERIESNKAILALRSNIQLLQDKIRLLEGEYQSLRVENEEYVLITSELNQKIIDIEEQKCSLQYKVDEQSDSIKQLYQKLEVADSKIQAVFNSRSWRLTESFRRGAGRMREIRRISRIIRREFAHHGLKLSGRRALRLLRNGGVRGAYRRLAQKGLYQQTSMAEAVDITTPMCVELSLSIVPYYIDPLVDSRGSAISRNCSVAVHLYLPEPEIIESIAVRLGSISQPFDLFVSVSEGTESEELRDRICLLLKNKIGKIFVEEVPNRGRDIAPMIVQFGQRLLNYDIVGHFHSYKSPHNQVHENWCDDPLDLLLGKPDSTGGTVSHIFEKLMTCGKIVFPEGRREILHDRSRWGESYELASSILKRFTNISIDQFKETEFSESGIFWARSYCLQHMLQLPLTFNDFPSEPIPADGSLAHALERLILIFASAHPGQSLRLHRRDSLPDYRCYESQEDFQTSIIHDEVKILSYYLPQFHPIPENDAWHGEGFTEWTKVRGATPLFRGHYQQHIPHSDIGYYLLDSPDVMRTQAEMMKKAGVYGQVFYHYWFDGRLILEQPAKMLLDAPDIEMPFCFCWANENWTRRWDGNESEVLLAQRYSDSDARAFINYLIPFFRDTRYIRVEDRPVLFVYRPSSIPDIGGYLKIWKEECISHGIAAPYIVSVLTRGATNPADFGMDAGVERVLHDWTEGGAPEIKERVSPFGPINGSILSYEDVARFYSAQTGSKDFTYFRSIIPMWDNTARYGSEAYVVHGSTPEFFQHWLEKLIRYTKDTLPVDRRFLLVNAWNEWAEGAHLEPDSRYGYSYLNSVGRALSEIPYASQAKASAVTSRSGRIHLVFTEYVRGLISGDDDFAKRLRHTINESTIFDRFTITVDEQINIDLPSAQVSDRRDADWVLEFRRPAFFSTDMIEAMITLAISRPESVIVPHYYGDSGLIEVSSNGSIAAHDAFRSPLLLYPVRIPDGGYKNFRVCLEARCFLTQKNNRPDSVLPIVTTIIRFHKSGDIELLRNALGCLAAMQSCICVPLIAAQDLSELQQEAIGSVLDEFCWHPNNPPQVHHYQSVDGNGDLRSKMLNESLRKVQSRYAAFLDYDDLLMPHAYDWLVRRLEKTEKAVAFGRVYSTQFSGAKGILLNRTRAFEYGFSYEDFFSNNNAPIHSFLLDLTQLKVDSVTYHDDHRFMEDYYLTLQLFTEENGDWESLQLNHYIGEYLHSIDRAHTLAFTDETDRERILKNPDYIRCNNRLIKLRAAIANQKQSLKQANG